MTVIYDLVRDAREAVATDKRYWEKSKIKELEQAIETAETGVREIFDELSFLPLEDDENL